jgi:hypothetical protein
MSSPGVQLFCKNYISIESITELLGPREPDPYPPGRVKGITYIRAVGESGLFHLEANAFLEKPRDLAWNTLIRFDLSDGATLNVLGDFVLHLLAKDQATLSLVLPIALFLNIETEH